MAQTDTQYVNSKTIDEYVFELNEDIQKFQCQGYSLTRVPDLLRFNQLIVVNIKDNRLTSLPKMGSSVRILFCSHNMFTELSELPPNLVELDCANNKLSSLPELPHTLTMLDCSYNLLCSLPSLPSTLTTLDCFHNMLKTIPLLEHTSLTKLVCLVNNLTALPPLPITLKQLNVGYNKINYLPELPSKLEVLCANNNYITQLPEIPLSLRKLVANNNKIEIIQPFSRYYGLYTVLDSNPIYNLAVSTYSSFGQFGTIMRGSVMGLGMVETDMIIAYINKLMKFRKFYYTQKYKPQFHKWLWIYVREKKIKTLYSPKRLAELLSSVHDENNSDEFQCVLDAW